MKNPVRPYLTATVAAMTAFTVALTPSASEPAERESTVSAVRVASPPLQLTATVEPLAVTDLPDLLAGWVQRIVVPPSASQPFPEPQFEPVVVGNSIGSAIINTYNAIEPWVRYGFELATYAVGWVPYVGWLSGQIMIFYNFGERIARSITYNIAYFLDGQVSFIQGLANVTNDTINSFIQLGVDQWNFWLPPLPPFPPFPFAATAAQPEELTMLASIEEVAPAQDGPEKRAEGEENVPAVQVGDEVTGPQGGTETEEPTTEGEAEPTDDTVDGPRATTDTSGGVSAQGEVRGPETISDGDVPVETPAAAGDDEIGPAHVNDVDDTQETGLGEAPSSPGEDPGTAAAGGEDGASGTE